jgi:phthalate 4,5-cis-dihydrodiol dehydrogenase
MHAEHVCLAAAKGKHALVEKPMALTIADCDVMIAAARDAGVKLIIGHSHSFDAPILQAREIIASGAVGKVSMITALNYTDFLYRPRRPEELITEQGGGVLFSQGAHQMDVIRLLGGGRVKSVRAGTGAWDAKRPTEGAYQAFLTFEDGAFASATYSGYAHFDSDEFTGWIGEMGQKKDAANYGATRRALARAKNPEEEATLKAARNYGGPDFVAAPRATDLAHQHFGLVVVSCEKADLRPLPNGVQIYADDAVRVEPLPKPDVPRAEVIDELFDAVVLGHPAVHTGEWALATLEVCLAVLQSSRERREIDLRRQVGLG